MSSMEGQRHRAILIDIEGIDGSGKGTQAHKLHQRLVACQIPTALISFPRYGQTLFGRAVGRYLNGHFGALHDVHPFLASLLFAGDRFESKQLLQQALSNHQVVVLDRYVPSNIAHQASKVSGPERVELVSQILEIEHQIYGNPRPDLVFWLDLPVPQAQELIARKNRREYTDRTADIQEADADYLNSVREVYQDLATQEAGWQRIDCLIPGSTEVASIDDLHQQIIHTIQLKYPDLPLDGT